MLSRRTVVAGNSILLSRYCETLGELALRKYSEMAMIAANAETQMASRAKTAFLGTMSHELRTPLNAIIGFSDLIAAAGEQPAGAESNAQYAEEISRAGRHMLEVISDILDISKIESGTFSLNLDEYALSEIIEGSVSMIRERIAQKKQVLDLRLNSDLPELVIDARRIKQILINLLSNANKFTPEGGRIVLAARRNADGGATVAVVDSGIGMSPDEIAVAVQPFGQVQSTYARSQEGTGLGLPIARGLARQHGGDLFLESEPGKGVSAVLTLRRSAEEPFAPLAIAPGGGERRRPRRGTIKNKDSDR